MVDNVDEGEENVNAVYILAPCPDVFEVIAQPDQRLAEDRLQEMP